MIIKIDLILINKNPIINNNIHHQEKKTHYPLTNKSISHVKLPLSRPNMYTFALAGGAKSCNIQVDSSFAGGASCLYPMHSRQSRDQ